MNDTALTPLKRMKTFFHILFTYKLLCWQKNQRDPDVCITETKQICLRRYSGRCCWWPRWTRRRRSCPARRSSDGRLSSSTRSCRRAQTRTPALLSTSTHLRKTFYYNELKIRIEWISGFLSPVSCYLLPEPTVD